jgi:hypothetical protein
VTFQELKEYWQPVAEKLVPAMHQRWDETTRGYRRYYMLDDLLGIHEYEHNYFRYNSGYPPLQDDLRKLLATLRDSPHAHAILRAYQIQRGIKP